MQNFEYTQEELDGYDSDILDQIAADYKIETKDKLQKTTLINKIIEVQELLIKKEMAQLKMSPFA